MPLDLKAEPGCCEECAMGAPFYIPCGKPAMHMVGWPYRREGPYRMCRDCAFHNIKNRGATIIGPYSEPKEEETTSGQ
jgi:hypothetical protein